MPSVYAYKNFKAFLRADLKQRMVRNSNYSQRAYARDLGVSVSRLSEILMGPEGIRTTTAHKIAKSLQLTAAETEYFLNLVISKCARSTVLRGEARQHVKDSSAPKRFVESKLNFETLLSKWYYSPLIELLTYKPHLQIASLAQALRISNNQVEEAIVVLEALGYIKKSSSQWVKSNPFIKHESPSPSQKVREFHHKMLRLADLELERQDVANRKYLSAVFCFQKNKLSEARAELERFKIKFLEKYTSTENADSVYGCTVQFFELSARPKNLSTEAK